MLDGKPVVGAEVTFESENPHYTFTQITAPDGTFAYGTKNLAGGAPAGTYRVKVVSGGDAMVPARYGSFDSSSLQFVCEARQNHVELKLRSAEPPADNRVTASTAAPR